MARILVVEDDEILREGILFALAREGHQVRGAGSLAGMKEQLGQPADLVVLDVSLPDGDSREFLPGLRESNPVPVIFLTARNTEGDMIAGFDAGADDYITKPFSVPLLVRRIQAVLNRSLCRDGRFYYNGDLRYDFDGKELKIGEKSIPLTPTEMRLLEVFLHNRRRVLTREMLLARVWDEQENYVDDKALAVNIRRLREKIEKEPGKPERIKTVFGIGYKWEEE